MSEAETRTPRPDHERPGATGSTGALVGDEVRRALKLRPATVVTLVLALGGVFLAWADPFDDSEANPVITSSRTGSRRLFPTLVDSDPSKATIELQASDGPSVRLVPGPQGGHQVMRNDELLGPADAAAFEGVWSSLRMATVLREAPKFGRDQRGDAPSYGQYGVLRITLPDASFTLSLGTEVSNGGTYAMLDGEGTPLVVERSMAWLVEQPAEKWLSTRLLDIETDAVTGLAWAGGRELVLGRGGDDYWRVRSGAPLALLSNLSVNARLEHLLRSKLDPFFAREVAPAESLRPWLAVTTQDGGSRTLLVGGACPDHPDKRLVDRGPGLFGCLPAEALEVWPLDDPDAGMIESQLIPHRYGRIVQIDLEQPEDRSLIRRGGEWSLSDRGSLESVSEDEVRRWFNNLTRVEVAPLFAPQAEEGQPDPTALAPKPVVRPEFVADTVLAFHTDTKQTLRVRCRMAEDPVICVRDEGPQLRVLGELPRELVFDAETFAQRRLVAFGTGEARELEIRPGPGGSVLRQSVHMDMGVWQLDAPTHVDGSGAIDEVRLENMLWALGHLRAEGWVQPPQTPPLRLISVEVVPESGARRTETVILFEDCAVAVEGHRPALVSAAQCEALSEDLLFDDPLRFWIERARSLEVSAEPESDPEVETAPRRWFVRREREQFVTDDGRELDDPALEATLQTWIGWRASGARRGEPETPLRWRVDVRREAGARVQAEIGDGWVRLRGADWYYVEREAEAGTALEDGSDGDGDGERPAFDPGALELE